VSEFGAANDLLPSFEPHGRRMVSTNTITCLGDSLYWWSRSSHPKRPVDDGRHDTCIKAKGSAMTENRKSHWSHTLHVRGISILRCPSSINHNTAITTTTTIGIIAPAA
jgi:hypothetical protein